MISSYSSSQIIEKKNKKNWHPEFGQFGPKSGLKLSQVGSLVSMKLYTMTACQNV